MVMSPEEQNLLNLTTHGYIIQSEETGRKIKWLGNEWGVYEDGIWDPVLESENEEEIIDCFNTDNEFYESS